MRAVTSCLQCEQATIRRGTLPRASGDQAGQALKGEEEARLIGSAGRQVDLDLGLQFDDASGNLQRLPNSDIPTRAPAGTLPHVYAPDLQL